MTCQRNKTGGNDAPWVPFSALNPCVFSGFRRKWGDCGMPVQQQRRAVDHGPAVDAVDRRTTARQRTSEVSNAANTVLRWGGAFLTKKPKPAGQRWSWQWLYTVALDRLPPRLLPTSPLLPSPVGQSVSASTSLEDILQLALRFFYVLIPGHIGYLELFEKEKKKFWPTINFHVCSFLCFIHFFGSYFYFLFDDILVNFGMYIHYFLFVCCFVFLAFIVSWQCILPWYNRTCSLGIKH